jgi:carotenoid cleavage dioxygenase-like enzyme
MSAAPAETPFHLTGNFAPVEREVTATDLPVEGSLPPELTGLYVRQSPNPKSGISPHWFLGDGMLHGVCLERGRAAWYRNRWVRTPYLANPDVQRISERGEIDRTVSKASTHVLRHAGRILALEEGSFPYLVDDRLETLG